MSLGMPNATDYWCFDGCLVNVTGHRGEQQQIDDKERKKKNERRDYGNFDGA